MTRLTICVFLQILLRVIELRKMKWAGNVARMEAMRNALNVLVEKPERKRPLGKLRHTWEDNIKMDLREIGREGVDCTHLTQDRDQWRAVVNTIMNIWVP
jgi:hypothetical protein